VASANTTVVDRAYEAWNRGDWTAVFDLFDPQIEVHPPALWPEAGRITGRENVRRAFEAALEASDRLPVLEVGERIDAGDRVLAHVLRTTGRGRGSGIALEVSFSQVFTITDGLISQIDFYLDRGDALAAVGTPAS
jgi:ketosteroid isomerase-like protein